ncbi:MAG TPA: sodium:glutamate symporter [Clostridiales bacterium]|nr:sodium:glutamate symporter [Clostridiales bacterium]
MNYSASNTQLWNFVIQLGILAAILLISNVMRRKVAFIQKSLAPTAVIGGFIALILRAAGILHLDGVLLEIITYHTIAIGFIALSLRIPKNSKQFEADPLVGPKSGALIVSTYLMQGILGIAITVGLSYTLSPGLFKASGILLPMGYGQGPGQANNVGATYEQLGFVGGQSFGLSLAAAGFLCACIVGVVYIYVLQKKKQINIQDIQEKAENLTIEDFQSENEIPVSQSVDRLSIQMSMVLMVYLAAYLVSWGITSLLDVAAPGLSSTVSPLIWGFNFIVGALLAMLFRQSFSWFRKAKLMKRQYPNNYLLSRISGFAFDFMIVAGIAAIDIQDLSGLWLPFIVLAIAGGYVTLVYLQRLCKRIYPDYYHESFLSMYGMMTGTISSGVMLLREVDPLYKTPAANNLLRGSSFGILFGAPMLILIGMAPKSDLMLLIVFLLLIVYEVFLLFFMLKPNAGRKI